MTLGSHDLAILSARMGVMRMGASRMGFCPDDVKHGGDEPGEYNWKEQKPPTTTWALQSQMSMCGKRRVALVLGATPNPQAALSPVQFTAAASGGWPPYSYRWLSFGEDGPWIQRVSDLAAYYPLNETSGTRAKALGSAASADLLEVGGSTPVAVGRFGNAVSHTSGSPSSLEVVLPTPLDFSGGFTVGLWVYLDPVSAYTPILVLGSSTASFPTVDVHRQNWGPALLTFISWSTNPNRGFQHADPNTGWCGIGIDTFPGVGFIPPAEWHLFWVWYDPVAQFLYTTLDDLTPPETTLVGYPGAGMWPANAAGLNGIDKITLFGSNFPGRVDSICIWTAALTASERHLMFNGSSDEQNPSYTYSAAGTYTAECRAVDEFGNSDTKTIDVTITAAHVIVSGTILYTEYSGPPNPTLPWPTVTVELFDSLNVSLGTDVTDANGFYEFTDIAANGQDVYIKVSAQLPPGEALNESGQSAVSTAAVGTTTINLTCTRPPI